jgi:hypothetical protein
MKSCRLRLVAAGAVLSTAALVVGIAPTMAGAAATGPYCGITWGSVAKADPVMTQAPVTGARVGRHDCFDRFVVDLGGRPAGGYSVRYIDPPYRAEGSGAPLFVAGGAVLSLSVHAPAYDDNGKATVPWYGTDIVVHPDEFEAAGFRTFRDLIWGGSYEGYSAFGLGVRARLPFRVMRLDGPGAGSRLVVDVAHRW